MEIRGSPALTFPAPSRAVALRAAAALGVVVVVTFGVHARSLGFYLDDWVLFERLLAGDGWWSRVRGLVGSGYDSRPLALLYWPTAFQVAGFEPARYQFLLMLQDWVLTCLYALFVFRWTGHRRLALGAAALAAMYPICPTAHQWVSNGAQHAALALTFASLLAHLRWLEERKPVALAAALAVFFASLFVYEAAAFLFFMQAAALFAALLLRGEAPRPAARRTFAVVLLPYGAVLAAGLFCLKFVVPALLGFAHPKAVKPNLHWFWVVYREALTSLGPEAWSLINNCRPLWWESFSDGMLVLWALFVLWGVSRLRGASEPLRGRWSVVAGLGAGGFVAAYLPYALSGAYEPDVVGILSRVNGNGVLVGGLALAAALEGLAVAGTRAGFPRAGRAVRGALAAVLIGAFTWTNWFIGEQWAEAYRLERQVLAKTAAWVRRMPYVKTLVLKGAPEHVNGSEVFKEDWGFSAALRIAVGRKDLQGRVFRPGMSTQADGLSDPLRGAVYPYDGLYLYDFQKDQVTRPVP